jgi:hypothetical protein
MILFPPFLLSLRYAMQSQIDCKLSMTNIRTMMILIIALCFLGRTRKRFVTFMTYKFMIERWIEMPECV